MMDVFEGIKAGLEDALAYEKGEPNGCVVHVVSDEDGPHHRRQKISKAKPPKKSKHKHVFEPCVLEFTHPYGKLTKEHGFQPERRASIGGYCPICGKVGPIDVSRWVRQTFHDDLKMLYYMTKWSDEALQELNPETRTLPTFDIGDEWLFPKFVDLEAQK